MPNIDNLTKFVLFLTILDLSPTSAKPTSPDDNKKSDDVTKFMNNYWDIELNCRKSEINDHEPISEQSRMQRDSCYKRCVFDKLGFMRNNTIDIEKISSTYDTLKNNGYGDEFVDNNMFEIFKKCAKETNSKHFEGKCDPLENMNRCIRDEKSAASKSQTEKP